MQPLSGRASDLADETTGANPRKLSLRALDNFSTREEDLEHGPLLLELGRLLRSDEDSDDHAASRPNQIHIDDDMDPSMHTITPGSPGSLECFLPLAAMVKPLSPYVESVPQSGSSVSRSFTVPTETTSLINASGDRDSNAYLLGLGARTIVQPTALPSPDEMEIWEAAGEAVESSYQSTHAPLLPWHYEFRWKDGQLNFAGEQLSTQMSSSASSIHIEVSSDMSSMSLSTSAASGPSSLLLSMASDQVKEQFIEALHDHYWRTCPASRKRSKGNAGSSNSPYSREGSRYLSRSTPSTSRKITQGSGSDDSNEGDGNDERNVPSSLSNEQRWFICPFAAWNPVYYTGCMALRLMRISDVKKHLEKQHFPRYCSNCLGEIDEGHYERCERVKNMIIPGRQPVFTTTDKLERIKERADRRMSHEEQWAHIWDILFPNTPRPSSYMDGSAIMLMNQLEDYCKNDGAELLAKKFKEISSNPLHSYLDAGAIVKMALSEWTDETFRQLRGANRTSFELQGQVDCMRNSLGRSGYLDLDGKDNEDEHAMCNVAQAISPRGGPSSGIPQDLKHCDTELTKICQFPDVASTWDSKSSSNNWSKVAGETAAGNTETFEDFNRVPAENFYQSGQPDFYASPCFMQRNSAEALSHLEESAGTAFKSSQFELCKNDDGGLFTGTDISEGDWLCNDDGVGQDFELVDFLNF